MIENQPGMDAMTIGYVRDPLQLLLEMRRSAAVGKEDREEMAGFARILAATAGTGMGRRVSGMLSGDARPAADAFPMSGMAGMGLDAAAFAFRGRRAPDSAATSGTKPATPPAGDPNVATGAKATREPDTEPDRVPEREPAPEMGFLAARYESASAGIAAIGYDSAGGTSYGKFQIASRPGTLGEFLEFLDREAPEWAERLRAAGPANTGGRNGAMPRVWRELAAESPEAFEALQRRFIRENHFEPARRRILQRTGLDAGAGGPALREVVFSTAVQHGPAGAAGIFEEAVSGAGTDEAALIRKVYEIRAERFRERQPDLAEVMARRYASESAAAEALRAERG